MQLFSRKWIADAIDPVLPLSSTCFHPQSVARSRHNSTLANAPAYVQLQAGIGLAYGNDCFDFASTIPLAPLPGMQLPTHTIFHTYGRVDLDPLGERQISLLHSLLAMQDRESTSVILWSNPDDPTRPLLRDSPLLAKLLRLYGPHRFSVREVDKGALAAGTPMEGSAMLDMADEKAWLDGDLVWILVLWAEGGIWVDMDTIMTGRDVRVLGESEWVTQWDCYGPLILSSGLSRASRADTLRLEDKPYQPLNGAMMHFHQHSPFLCEMLHAMAHDAPPRRGTTNWGLFLYHKVWRRLVAHGIAPFKILPYCFTDGVLCRLDNRLPDPFASRDSSWGQGRGAALRRKFDSVWAVHLHNQWDRHLPQKGWVRKLILDKVNAAVERYRKAKEAAG